MTAAVLLAGGCGSGSATTGGPGTSAPATSAPATSSPAVSSPELTSSASASAPASHVTGHAGDRGPGPYRCFRFSVHVSESTLRNGNPASFSVVATNATDRPCTDKPPCSGITAGWKVLDESGAVVYEQTPVGPACASGQPSPDVVAAGDSTTWDSSSWAKTAPGRYRIRWQWLDAVDVESDWFTVLPG